MYLAGRRSSGKSSSGATVRGRALHTMHASTSPPTGGRQHVQLAGLLQQATCQVALAGVLHQQVRLHLICLHFKGGRRDTPDHKPPICPTGRHAAQL